MRQGKIRVLRPGDSIAGRYEIIRSVRSGGLSVVFEATDKKTNQRVAVKIINVQPRDDAALLRRIEREIKILTSLSHPHVVACFGAGAIPDGRPYLVLEWLEGEDLADFKLRSPMTLRRVLEVAGQVADALAAAHTLGIIHRDIKPANIYLVRPQVNVRLDCRVIDFGVAKMPQANAAITRAGAILGTPSYMAPEQASYAMDVDARADVFSLGVVTFELLTGRLPWQSSTDLARLARIMVEPPIKVHDLNPEVPNIVADFIDQMLKLKVGDRLATARAVHDRVVAALRDLPDGILETTYTRDPELLSGFVRQPTVEIPAEGNKKRRKTGIGDLKTEGLDFGPSGFSSFLEPRVEDVVAKEGADKPKERSVVTEAIPPKEPTPPAEPISQKIEVLTKEEAARKEHGNKASVEATKLVTFGEVETPAGSSPSPVRTSSPRAPKPTAELRFAADAKAPDAQRALDRAEDPPTDARTDPKPPPAPEPPQRPYDEQVAYFELAPSSLLFGRVPEIDSLRLQILRTLNTDKASTTVVVGPAGIGKSRVRMELTRIASTAPKAPLVISARAEEGSRSSPYSFLRRILLQEARIHSDDPPAEKRRKMLELIPKSADLKILLLDAEPPLPGQGAHDDDGDPNERTRFSIDELWSERPSMIAALKAGFGEDAGGAPREGDEERATVAAFVAAALKIPHPDLPPVTAARSDPRLMGAQVRRCLDILLRQLARKSGLIVLVDDAHLLDQASAQVLAGLAKPRRGVRVAVFAFGLPALVDDKAKPRSPLAEQPTKTIELSALDARASREFARSLVKGSLESGSLEILVKRAQGNPLYLEQLVRAVQTTGVLALNEGGEYELKGLRGNETDDDKVPPTIAAAVAQRIGALKHDLARTLSAAAVFGEVFWVDGVAKLTEETREETLSRLDLLIKEGLVRRRAAPRYRAQLEMEVAHSVVRSVALARLKRKRRHRYERTAIEYLKASGEEDEGLLAVHVANSGRIEESAALYEKAAEGALSLGSLESAAALADEALLLAEGEAEPTTKVRLLELVHRIAVMRRDVAAAGDALEALLSLATGDRALASIHTKKSYVALLSARFEEAQREASIAGELFNSARDAIGEAEAGIALGEALEALGDNRRALRAFVQAQSIFSNEDDAKGMARATRGLARIAIASGDYRTAENRFREALVHAHTTRDREAQFGANLGLAEVARLMGLEDKARELLEDALRVTADEQRYLMVELMRARLLEGELEVAEAMRKLDRLYAISEGRPELARVRRLAALYHAQLAIVRSPFSKEEVGSIKARLEGVADSAMLEEPPLLVAIDVALGVLFALEGDYAEAKKRDARALERFLEEGAAVEEEPPRILLAHARVLEAADERTEDVRQAWKSAVEHLDSIASRLERKARKRYLSRPTAEAILKGAERAGLKLSRNASSNRIAAADV
jgi:eukaryotic-like serine/threonine-protein kinase